MKAAVITISDSRTKDTDTSGKDIIKILIGNNFTISNYEIIKDDTAQIKKMLIYYSDVSSVDLVLTTGGTGIGPRDVTPEATSQVIEKRLTGVSEYIRTSGVKKTKNALLSRAEAGIRKNTLIINLPGSPKGAKESLKAVLDIIPHAINMIKGKGH